MNRGKSLVWLLLLAGVIAGAWLLYRQHEADKAETARRATAAAARREAEAQERAVRTVAAVEDESRALMPEMLRNVAIGMAETELRTARPRLRRATSAHEAGKDWLEEDLPNGAQILYALSLGSRRLLQVQILSVIPSHGAITPHLTAMNDQYGTPTGVWDCAASDGLVTRRFTWRKNMASVMDVFLIYGERISLTLYIAPTETIQQSLALGNCRPVSRENLDAFPVVNAEAMRARAQAGGPRNPGNGVRSAPGAPTITVGPAPGHP